MIEAGKLYILSKSGNEVRAISVAQSHEGLVCWTVERTKGASIGKQMIVPACALVASFD